ncbi:uncharacterized protein LOC105183155 isoform X2 [Harpegnathos saltator]|uniref:uncharacterized protein LOC105183155 isoform X2 n=1 Tax=Harpegnathos saltator TaxID=610380 RepID=UPI00058ECF17|nr:uncharacterized protein LOC105183155 isoform X2 [Harpegnathos saltator]
MDVANMTVYTDFGTLEPYQYNSFFHPNLCHVCKLRNNGNLIECNQCRLISYCSEEHRLLHESEHSRICADATYAVDIADAKNYL